MGEFRDRQPTLSADRREVMGCRWFNRYWSSSVTVSHRHYGLNIRAADFATGSTRVGAGKKHSPRGWCSTLQAYLVRQPDAGDLIKQTGGLRKMRWMSQG